MISDYRYETKKVIALQYRKLMTVEIKDVRLQMFYICFVYLKK